MTFDLVTSSPQSLTDPYLAGSPLRLSFRMREDSEVPGDDLSMMLTRQLSKQPLLFASRAPDAKGDSDFYRGRRRILPGGTSEPARRALHTYRPR